VTKISHAPDGFELLDHQSPPGWFHRGDGVVISVHVRDVVDRMLRGRYPYRVIMAEDQRTRYDGVFATQQAAERQARHLAERYADRNR